MNIGLFLLTDYIHIRMRKEVGPGITRTILVVIPTKMKIVSAMQIIRHIRMILIPSIYLLVKLLSTVDHH